MSKVLQKACKELRVVTAEARSLVIEIAGPRQLGDTTESMLARAARRLGFQFARTSNIYRGRARIIRAEEWIRLNEEAAALRDSAKARREALHEIDLLAAGKSPAETGVDARSPDLAGDAGEPSLPLES